MCNKLHKDSVPIRKSGFGYKAFIVEDGILKSWYLQITYKTSDSKPAEKFEKAVAVTNDHFEGFCFFPNKKDANKAYKLIGVTPAVVIKRIKYFGGKGKHIDDGFARKRFKIFTALCTEFYPVDGWEVK